MKKIIIISLLLFSGWMSAGAVDLNKENRDPKYVESIINRSQKIVDKLGITDAKVAEDVRNIIANRYFELNDIYEVRDAKVKKVKESGFIIRNSTIWVVLPLIETLCWLIWRVL